tara:strand:+ start:372 stop:575 length:204 start_codon:yes stop_codon:yes gene_type:complete
MGAISKKEYDKRMILFRDENSDRALIEIIKNKVYDDWDYSQLVDLNEFIEKVMADKKPDNWSDKDDG